MRITPLRDPVTLTFDGRKVLAERGEPVAAALVGSGSIILARSAKFHRPRGPACFRGACDGCLARVDDAPNVMTCMIGARDGMRIDSQNALGTRDTDFLRMTDWFFPQGMNHHELFAGVPGLQQVMQVFARRVAGLGRLPNDVTPKRASRRREVDVLVVGAGPSGMAVASAFARRGREVLVIDDSLVAGGVLRALDEVGVRPWRTIFDAFARDVASGAVTLRCETTAGGFYGNDLLVVSAKPRAQAEGQARRADDAIGAEVIEARAFVIATGAHDGVLAFEGNDLPGVMSARAAGWLLSRGVLAGQKVVVVVSDGGGPFGEAYARGAARMRAPCEVLLVHGEPVRARGSSRVKGISVRVGRKSAPGDATAKAIDYTADAVLIDAPRSPSYELCEQAGATLDHRPEGFVARTLRGKLRDGVWAIGEVTGTPLDPVRIARAAEEIASQA